MPNTTRRFVANYIIEVDIPGEPRAPTAAFEGPGFACEAACARSMRFPEYTYYVLNISEETPVPPVAVYKDGLNVAVTLMHST